MQDAVDRVSTSVMAAQLRAPASGVRATDEEWVKIVTAGAPRGLMFALEDAEAEVFRDGKVGAKS